MSDSGPVKRRVEGPPGPFGARPGAGGCPAPLPGGGCGGGGPRHRPRRNVHPPGVGDQGPFPIRRASPPSPSSPGLTSLTLFKVLFIFPPRYFPPVSPYLAGPSFAFGHPKKTRLCWGAPWGAVGRRAPPSQAPPFPVGRPSLGGPLPKNGRPDSQLGSPLPRPSGESSEFLLLAYLYANWGIA